MASSTANDDVSASPRSNYFKGITSSLNNMASVRKLPHRGGVGLVADADIEASTLMWAEKPMYGVCTRDIPVDGFKDLCCDLCSRYCGSLTLQLKVLFGHVSHKEACRIIHEGNPEKRRELLEAFEVTLPGLEDPEDGLFGDGLPLVRRIGPDTGNQGCNGHGSDPHEYFMFCSDTCAAGWDALVGEDMSMSEEFLKYYEFVRDEEIGALYLVLLCLAAGTVLRVPKHSGVAALCGEEYWKCTDPDEGESLEDHVKVCDSLCHKAASLLRDLQSKFPSKLGKREITAQDVSQIMGQLCRNMIQVSHSSPVFEYVASLGGLSEGAQNSPAMLRLKEMLAELPEVHSAEDLEGDIVIDLNGFVMSAEQIPSFQGWAVFPMLSTVNHSCEPNLDVDFVQGDFTLTVTSRGDIKKGDELFISYLDDMDADTEKRRMFLKSYGFTCECVRCCAETPDEAVSSPHPKKARIE